MKMISIKRNIQSEILMTTMEEIVPKDSLFRKVDKYIDFAFIYDEVKDLYCSDNGRPSIDPVVLFKLVFIVEIRICFKSFKFCFIRCVVWDFSFFVSTGISKSSS